MSGTSKILLELYAKALARIQPFLIVTRLSQGELGPFVGGHKRKVFQERSTFLGLLLRKSDFPTGRILQQGDWDHTEGVSTPGGQRGGITHPRKGRGPRDAILPQQGRSNATQMGGVPPAWGNPNNFVWRTRDIQNTNASRTKEGLIKTRSPARRI